VARAAKHSKAVVEESVTSAPSVAAPVVVPVAPVPAAPVVIPATVVSAPAKSVSQEEIAKLAYCFWADRGYQGGSPEEDWARAEQTLLAQL